MKAIVKVLEFGDRIVSKYPKKDRSRMRIRICHIGPECPSCDGAAWIEDCSTKKPTPGCVGKMVPSPSARAYKARVLRCLPEWLKPFVSF